MKFNLSEYFHILFFKDPHRHRQLEKQRRDRTRSVFDTLQSKIPKAMMRSRVPNKTKPPQIDVLHVAIDYIEELEKRARNTDDDAVDEDRRRCFEMGYQECTRDLYLILERENIRCRDAVHLMKVLEENSPPQFHRVSENIALKKNISFLGPKKYPENRAHFVTKDSERSYKRSHEYTASNDPLNHSVFKRPKHRDSNHRRNRNSILLQNSVCRPEFSKPLLRNNEQSLLVPASSKSTNDDAEEVEILIAPPPSSLLYNGDS